MAGTMEVGTNCTSLHLKRATQPKINPLVVAQNTMEAKRRTKLKPTKKFSAKV